MKIHNRHTGGAIYESDAPTVKETVENAVKARANLAGANLKYANLKGARLARAKGIISIGPVGRQNRIIYAVRHPGAVYVKAGCFWGTLEEFACAVIAKYGERRDEYDAAIRLIRAKFKTPEGGKR